MARRLDTRQPDFDRRFADLLGLKRESAPDVRDTVAGIIDDVRARGDSALLDLTRRFDGFAAETAGDLVLDTAELAAAHDRLDPDVRDALALAAERIRAFHQRQLPADIDVVDACGVRQAQVWRPVAAAGVYVPGGTAAYPSSVLMNLMPARVAGVPRVVMVTPTRNGQTNDAVLAAAHLAGVDEVYRVGGAQAVAALAFGTAMIRPVDVIVGPGNAYVAQAKRQVFGQVGIDMIAGPSEILVVADADNDPAWIAADLISQAEHDSASQSILITDDAGFAGAVAAAVESLLADLPRGTDHARPSWTDNGAIILVPDLADLSHVVALIDAIAPEHLELAVAAPEPLARAVRNAGAVFLGRHTPEAVGDYVGGPNHVLPTSRAARYASGLGVIDFMKRTTWLGCTPESLSRIGPAAVTLAGAEGLHAHARSVALRLTPQAASDA